MRVSIVLEQRFIHTRDGVAYDNGHATFAHWQRYLRVFEEVQVVGRSQLVTDVPPGFLRVDGPGVRFLPVPYYHGPLGLLRRLANVSAALWHGLEAEEAVIVRLSGVLGHLAATFRWLRGQPFAAEVINDPYLGYGPDGTRHSLRPLFRALLTALTRLHCRQAVAVQYVTREALQRSYPPGKGVPSFGVSDAHLPPVAFVSSPRVYTGPAQRAVLVGSLEQRHKGVDLAVRALARLRMDGHDLHLKIVGDGPLRPELEALAQELGVADACAFAGQRSTPAEVRRDLAEAEMLLIPSRTEGLPRALLEAMAQGLPAAGSRVGGIPELLPPGAMVPPGDVAALAQVWGSLSGDPARLTAQSERNLALALTYADASLDALRTAFLSSVRASNRVTSNH